MKVMTFDMNEFRGKCRDLASLVNAGGVKPCYVIGIRNGGAIVADEISSAFPGAMKGYVASRRPSTAEKKKGGRALRRLFRIMPLAVLDVLRMAESVALRFRKDERRSVEWDEATLALFAAHDNEKPCVLLVDDAVDSGYTLRDVALDLMARLPGCRIVTAALTVTTPHPVMTADYALYRDNTLVRFPWSIDAR